MLLPARVLACERGLCGTGCLAALLEAAPAARADACARADAVSPALGRLEDAAVARPDGTLPLPEEPAAAAVRRGVLGFRDWAAGGIARTAPAPTQVSKLLGTTTVSSRLTDARVVLSECACSVVWSVGREASFIDPDRCERERERAGMGV